MKVLTTRVLNHGKNGGRVLNSVAMNSGAQLTRTHLGRDAIRHGGHLRKS